MLVFSLALYCFIVFKCFTAFESEHPSLRGKTLKIFTHLQQAKLQACLAFLVAL